MKFKHLFQGWNLFEVVWLTAATIIITTLALMGENTWVGLISSISGILCVVLAAKGKLATFFFGIIQAATYAWVAYGYKLYGEAMLNAFFFLPFQFVGIYLWLKHSKKDDESLRGEEVFTKKLTKKQWLVLVPLMTVSAIVYAFILSALNAQQVRLDSVAVVLSIFAQFLMVLRYAEQWILWIVINILTITLWFIVLVQQSGNDWSILAMWCAFLVNSVYGYWNWRKLALKDTVEAVA